VGLKLDDVDLTELSYPNMTAALASQNIDAATSIEPFATQAVLKKVATRFKTWAELGPNDNPAMVMFSPIFAEQRSEAARRFAKAYVHGVRDYETARNGGPGREEAIASMIKHLDIKDRALYDQIPWPSINPNGRMNADSIASAQDWFFEHGYVKKRVDLTQVVDSQFADYAVAQLGPYQS
jgi:NitT/TauT family transport system substrate-binding protein